MILIQFHADWEGLDIGPKTVEQYAEVIKESKLVIWNGPMGVFEMDAFADGTKGVAEALAETEAIPLLVGETQLLQLKSLVLLIK